jgi:GNAT superfamily N-acetyltransferase
VGVATVAPEGHPVDPRPGDWRLRGMATAPAARGRGVGAALLRACLDHARARGGARVWCNARVTAEGFYLGAGFVPEGGRFDIPGLGEHVVMTVSLRP